MLVRRNISLCEAILISMKVVIGNCYYQPHTLESLGLDEQVCSSGQPSDQRQCGRCPLLALSGIRAAFCEIHFLIKILPASGKRN